MTSDVDRQVEELLEQLWVWGEQPRSDAGVFEPVLDADPELVIAAAERRGWVARRREGLVLTPMGEHHAAGVIRRHRLAERLLGDVIQVDSAAMEAAACELEHSHILSDEATDRVCAFLGHPPTCPHDRPIPRGRCCEKFSHEALPLVTPLSAGAVGETYRVVFVASRSHRRMDRLCALGVAPGARLRLHQKLPAFVVRVGETDIALDPDVTDDVFVAPC
jgi:DtxR family Mn-dependent transcriptional regulator